MAYGIHPSFDITGTLGSSLKGKQIILCITGSVAAVRSSEIARLLMRHGATVYPVMSESACKLISPDLMEWACGFKPVTTLTGAVEHVALAGNVQGKADLVLVAPSTANTISKIACGIDDTPVTTVVTTALGEHIPLIVVPAMHEPMYRHPFVLENIKKLQNAGITVMTPRIQEGKAKIPENQEIVDKVCQILCCGKLLAGKKVLITSGRTVEYIDPVRVITNNSTGKMGFAVAQAAADMGADVTVVYGKGSVTPPAGIRVINVSTAEEMRDAVQKELADTRYDIMLAAAAVGDWQPVSMSKEKISTRANKNLVLELRPTPKIIDNIKNRYPDVFLVAFRALHDLPESELLSDGKRRMTIADADMIAVNDVSLPGHGFESDTNEMLAICKDGDVKKLELTSKYGIALKLLKFVIEKMEVRNE
ncbi:MAG: bifunctional phosphopantothenoylcysteine decarboxylase/phosphopantothenate--cysteine ligase CoaBC [Spirochaetia bacterium]|nr:bifunctional phosphopantothenoylcysteine decarboxylase/phosphopantothenate--cysteine ligase CoaBC [Spirochaetia bacterium]